MSETIKALEIVAWLKFIFMPACREDHKDILKIPKEAPHADPFNDIDQVLLDLEMQLMKDLASEYHRKVVRPSGIESDYLYLKED
ncbi:MAG: hypothetical protein QXD42_05510 [Nitrososphaerales archaeon]